MSTIVRRNERSWAIELISEINSLVDRNNISIKRAGGENTISTHKNTMFPDVILYGNKEQTVFLQGWELKMPDVPIEDETFIKDAQRKAIALDLNSCLIWNFTYAVLYVKGTDKRFKKVKQWNDTSHIRTREDVKVFRKDWEEMLKKVIFELNEYFITKEFRDTSLSEIVSVSIITTLIERNKTIVAEKLRNSAITDTIIDAYINNWWQGVESEYQNDETDRYEAYAKNIVLNWANRIIFAHLIKKNQNGALIINNVSDDTTPRQANDIFDDITKECDFYNIFSKIKYDELLPKLTWQDFVELSDFLKNNGIETLDQQALQNILERSVATNKRAINGQFTTPKELAKILVRLTMTDKTSNILDCCCGTGTIPKECLKIKKEIMTPREAVESVWACDKYQFPLQVANISMADVDTMNMANRLFQHNALTLKTGEIIVITDPEKGGDIKLELPKFDSIVSNLPFVPFEIIMDDDKEIISKTSLFDGLDERSDLYCYIALKVSDILKEDGKLGIITSNSWLGTKAGVRFVDTLKKKYSIKQIHISGKGRWFKNADVVTTIMILENKISDEDSITEFWLWKESLDSLKANINKEDTLVNSALLSEEIDPNISKVFKYNQKEIEELLSLNVSYNSLFHDVKWLIKLKDKLVRLNQVFSVFRGSRRGWDAMFYPEKGEHKIEEKYLRKVLKNARNVRYLTTKADSDAFCCGQSIEKLKENKDFGTLEWIEKFEEQKNGVGKLLPVVLKRQNMHWYELKENEIAEFFTMMNPDKRFFFARFEEPSFINQRLIGLNQKQNYLDTELNHALLNSVLTMFYIEASGFGRGLGVLDINKTSISNCYMLNPKLVSIEDRHQIVDAFNKLKKREILNVSEELEDKMRINFEMKVLKAFGLEGYFDDIKSSLISMQETRFSVKEN